MQHVSTSNSPAVSPRFVESESVRLLRSRPLQNSYLVARHGHAGTNGQRILASNLNSDKEEYGLTRQGLQEAQNLGLRISDRLVDLVQDHALFCPLILTSPLRRASETARVIQATLASDWSAFRGSAPAISLQPELLDRQWGPLEGQPCAAWDGIRASDSAGLVAAQGVEGADEFLERIARFLCGCERVGGLAYVIVTHCDVAQGIRELLNPKFPIETSHYSSNGEIATGGLFEVLHRSVACG